MIASAAHGGAASPAALCSAPLGRRNRRALLTDYRRGEEEDHGVGDGHDGFGDGEDDLLHRLDLAEEPAECVAASPSSRAHALRDRAAARELFASQARAAGGPIWFTLPSVCAGSRNPVVVYGLCKFFKFVVYGLCKSFKFLCERTEGERDRDRGKEKERGRGGEGERGCEREREE